METARRYAYRRSWGRIVFDLLVGGGMVNFYSQHAGASIIGFIAGSTGWWCFMGIMLLAACFMFSFSVMAAVSRLRGRARVEVLEDAVVVPHQITMRHLRIPIASITSVWESVKGKHDFGSSLCVKSTVGMSVMEAGMFRTKEDYDEVREFIRRHPALRCRWSLPRTQTKNDEQPIVAVA